MSDPVGNQSSLAWGGSDQDGSPAKEPLPPPGNPISRPSTRDSANARNDTNTHIEKTTFDIVARLVEIVVGSIVGMALVGIGYFQYTVYTRQAEIMETQIKFVDASQRPFVSIKEIRHFAIDPNFEAHPEGDETYNSWIFEPIWRNAGNTATHNLRVLIDRAILTKPRPFGDQEPALWRAPRDGKWRDAFIPAKAEVAAQDYYVTLAQLLASQRGDADFYYRGEATYQSTYSSVWYKTRFCYFLTNVRGRDPKFTMEFRQCIHGNCADDECERQDHEH